MKTFFDILQGIFYFLTILIGIFFLRGEILFSAQVYEIVKAFIMPGYLVFAGIMLGTLISNIRSKGKQDSLIYTKGFIIGIIVGIILAITYMFI